MEYNLIYKCRRCNEIYNEIIEVADNTRCAEWMMKNLFVFHDCKDYEGIGIADLIGNGEIIIDK